LEKEKIKNMKQEFLAKILPLCVGVFVLSIIISYAVLAWTEPSTTSPGGNIAAPINTGNIAQSKDGALGFGGTSSGLMYWIKKIGDSFALVNNADQTNLTLGQDGHLSLNQNNALISNVKDPIANQDAATKAYVDAQVISAGAPKGTCQGNLLSIQFTAATYDGNLGGVAGANEKCNAEYPGYHFCHENEVYNAGRIGCLPNPLQFSFNRRDNR